MNRSLRLLPCPRTRGFRVSPILSYGRTATYRRICSEALPVNLRRSAQGHNAITLTQLLHTRPLSIQLLLLHAPFPATRSFSSAASRFQEQRKGEGVRDPPRQSSSAEDTEGETANASAEGESQQSSQQGKEQSTEGEDKEQKKKEEPPPPPPHGDKTPWQVFTETLRSEFKASKEWNESTKALASSAHQFTESESVKKARAAYTAASGTAASTTSSAIKTTGKALGQGAAWTWDTPVVKGVRAGVNATGRGIAAATKPVRDTEVYKTAVGGVKDVIDDGSSSRYGGWVEKEERRKQRELRELNEARASGRPGKRVEKIEEDPKYVSKEHLILVGTNITTAPVPTLHCTKTPSGKNHGEISKIPTGSCNRFSL